MIALLAGAALVIGASFFAIASSPVPAAASTTTSPPAAPATRTCDATPQPGHFSCFALKRTDMVPFVQTANAVPNGYGPSALQSAYNLPSATAGVGQTVAVVDAFDDPNAESDLMMYRSQFGLPACTTANGCFRKVNQSGQSSPLPPGDTGWAGEESLDLDAVSAVCPNCHILLVEATDDSANLFVAINTAVALGAEFVSLSWGGSESAIESSFDAAYLNHPGVVITASTGDSGFAGGTAYPAASPDVVAVGGTSLSSANNARGWTETAWSGGGSGCSAFEPIPSFQAGVTGCLTRGVADLAADADPRTGVAVYQTYGGAGWTVYGGTSLASPIIAASYALAGPRPAGDNPVADPYAHASQLNDVTSGSTGLVCSLLDLCNARAGWDGPTGLGTPNGVGAFRGANFVSVTNPGDHTTFVSTVVGLQVHATDSDGSAALTYAATNLPPGLSINAANGLIGGSPTTVGRFAVTVSVTDQAAGSGSAAFVWTITSSGWSAYASLASGAIGSPTVSSWSTGRLDVFWVGSSGSLMQMFYSGAWYGPLSLGGQWVGQPAAVSWGPGRVDVFGEGVGGTLQHIWWDGSRWQGPEVLATGLASSPTVSTWGVGRLDVFYLDSAGHLATTYYNGAWHTVANLGGTWSGSPSAVAWTAGRIDVFGQGVGGTLQHLWYSGAWMGPENLRPAGSLIAAPAVASWSAGRLDVFWVDGTGLLQHLWYSGAWMGPESLGGSLTGAPAAVSWSAANRIDVFADGTDQTLQHIVYDASNMPDLRAT